MLKRYVRGIRRYCPKCNKTVTPYLLVDNDQTDTTVGFALKCDCGYIIADCII